MATFRTGFKIFGEISLKQSIGRIRSFSEDRKPGQWMPEDQWAVRPPCTTCPDPCEPKKPPKPSKSWLSICKDPEPPPLTCDIRHNNCPPPPIPVEEPWYAFMTKKKAEKPKPPLESCRMEMQKQAEEPDEDYCEDMVDRTWPACYEQTASEEPVCPERPPAPVIRLSCPPPKDLDLMLWCGKPGLSACRIASQCQSDRLPYDEFKPRKPWKNPPFSLPSKCEVPTSQPFCSNLGRAAYSEYKQVEIPKPLYTRYKSVELQDENFLLCMTNAPCPTDDKPSIATQPPPLPTTPKMEKEVEEGKGESPCPEKPVLVAASRKPVKLKCAPKFKFRPKPTKLVEKRHFRNPCAQHSQYNLKNLEEQPPSEESPSNSEPNYNPNPPKVITGTITDEPQVFERNIQPGKPPSWMYMLSKPGSKDTPLVPQPETYPKEPDWCGETDGLKFYDGQDEGIHPKPPPDPCKVTKPEKEEKSQSSPSTPPPPLSPEEVFPSPQEKFVLMPEEFKIRNMRPPEEPAEEKSSDFREPSFQEFIESKTTNLKTCSKSYPQPKENILYDLIRNCPLPPFDPSKPEPPPRRPPPPECPQPMRFYYRRYSTFSLKKPDYASFLNRMKSDDSREKCKPRKLVPKPRECGEAPPKEPTCNEMELPCCKKARIPPKCDFRKTMPPCKKRLPPKPSFSECTKDPPPCPRITECNAWDKKEIEVNKGPRKGRRFSSWAFEREKSFAEGDLTKSADAARPATTAGGRTVPGPSYSEYLDRGQSLTKTKLAKYAHKPGRVFSGKELMLNFVNPTEDGNAYYKSDSLVSRRRKPELRKLRSSQVHSNKNEESVRNQLHEKKVISALLQDHHTRNDSRANNLCVQERENGSQKPVTNSIGSWIQGLLKGQRKRTNSWPQTRIKANPTSTYVDSIDVDRIMKLTKPLRSKSLENLFSYYPEGTTDGNSKKRPSSFRRLWGRHRNKAFAVYPGLKRERARSSMWKFETLSPTWDFNGQNLLTVNGKEGKVPHQENSVVNRSNEPRFASYRYIVPTVDRLNGKNLFLNLNRTLHNGNRRELHNRERSSIRRHAILASDVPKPLQRMEPHRTETNMSSQDIVQSLIKKVKVTRSAPSKRKDSGGKVKFRQSATNSLVTTKKETERSSRGSEGKLAKYTESEKAVVALTTPQKQWIYIDRGCDIRYDVNKNIAHATVIKRKPKKWIQDMDDFSGDSHGYLYEGKKSKKRSEAVLRDDLKYCADKYLKRQEVRNMLSKLEMKKSVHKVTESAKLRQKEYSKKDIVSMLEEKVVGRFGWQHALFRNNPRQTQKVVAESPSEPQSLLDQKSLDERVEAKKLDNDVELIDSDLDTVVVELSQQREKLRWTKLPKELQPKISDRLIGRFTYEKPSPLSLESKGTRPIALPKGDSKGPSLRAGLHTKQYVADAADGKLKESNDKRTCAEQNEGLEMYEDPKSRLAHEQGPKVKKGNRKAVDELSSKYSPNKKPGPNCPDTS